MNFKLWLMTESQQDVKLYIDLDQTLILNLRLNLAYTFVRRGEERDKFYKMSEEEKIKYLQSNFTVFKYKEDTYVLRVRPQSVDFLLECQKLAPTYILTAGLTAFQKDVVKQSKLPINSENVFGRDSYGTLPKSTKGILIDDASPEASGVRDKFRAIMGFDNEIPPRHIPVKSWHGIDDDNDLMQALSEIKQLILS